MKYGHPLAYLKSMLWSLSASLFPFRSSYVINWCRKKLHLKGRKACKKYFRLLEGKKERKKERKKGRMYSCKDLQVLRLVESQCALCGTPRPDKDGDISYVLPGFPAQVLHSHLKLWTDENSFRSIIVYQFPVTDLRRSKFQNSRERDRGTEERGMPMLEWRCQQFF